MFQQDGGILDVRTACAAQIAAARTRGVEFSPLTSVLDMSSSADRVTVTTDRGVFTAGNAVVCVASWIEKLAPSPGLRWNMSLTQEQVSYFATPHLRDFTPDRFPMWIWHGDDNDFYGFPIYGEAAVKIARDMSGRFITSDERSDEPRADEPRPTAHSWKCGSPGQSALNCSARPASTTCPRTATSSSTEYPATPDHHRHRRRSCRQVRQPDRPHPQRPDPARQDAFAHRGVRRRPARADRPELRTPVPHDVVTGFGARNQC